MILFLIYLLFCAAVSVYVALAVRLGISLVAYYRAVNSSRRESTQQRVASQAVHFTGERTLRMEGFELAVLAEAHQIAAQKGRR